MSTSTKNLALALLITGAVSLFAPALSRAADTDKPTTVTTEVPFAAVPHTVTVENVKGPVQTADQAAASPADQADKSGVIYRRLSGGNLIASHYGADGKLTRRDIYRQPNELDVIHYNAAGKVTMRQNFIVTLDVYLRKGKFGYQHQWLFGLRRLELFHADGKTHSKVVVFHALGGQPSVARDINERGGTIAIRKYRFDGSRSVEETYKGGRLVKITRHAASENVREDLDKAQLSKPEGTILIDSEADDQPKKN